MNVVFEGYWGIDVSKQWIDIAQGEQVFRVEQKAIKKFITKAKIENKKILAVVESTGGYEQLAVHCLSKADIVVHIAHPNKVKAFARAKGRLAKTDKIDAILLREYGVFINIDEIKPLQNKGQYELHLLGSRLEQLKEMHHQESCRLGILSEESVKRSIRQILGILKEEIKKVKECILKMIVILNAMVQSKKYYFA